MEIKKRGIQRIKWAVLCKTRRPKNIKAEEPPGWFKKKRPTVNAKLRQAIIDVMPLNTTKEEADVILHAIFDYLKDEILTNGKCKLPGLGSIRLHKIKARIVISSLNGKRTVYHRPDVLRARFYSYDHLRAFINADNSE